LLSAESLRVELARVAPRIHDDPRTLSDVPAWRSMRRAVARARQCWFYLRDFGDAGAPAALDRLQLLDKVMVADQTRINELKWGRRAGDAELCGLIEQATPGAPSLATLVRYYESRTSHHATRSLDQGAHIELVDDGAVRERLRSVKLTTEGKDLVAELTFAELPIEKVLAAPSGSMEVISGLPEWDERADAYCLPLPASLVLTVRVSREAKAQLVQLKAAANLVEVRFLAGG
jgi:hypothetical protein